MKNILFLFILFLPNILFAQDEDDFYSLANLLNGSIIIAQDNNNTFLGKISSSYDYQSIFNEYGSFGNKYSTKSIWNQLSIYYTFDELSTRPPMIVKNDRIIGYITTNKEIRGGVSPYTIKELKKYFSR